MSKAMVIQGCVLSAVAALVIGATPASAVDRVSDREASVQLAQAVCRTFGPYATMRRANEVANQASSNGYNALPFHNGDGYYVRVC